MCIYIYNKKWKCLKAQYLVKRGWINKKSNALYTHRRRWGERGSGAGLRRDVWDGGRHDKSNGTTATWPLSAWEVLLWLLMCLLPGEALYIYSLPRTTDHPGGLGGGGGVRMTWLRKALVPGHSEGKTTPKKHNGEKLSRRRRRAHLAHGPRVFKEWMTLRGSLRYKNKSSAEEERKKWYCQIQWVTDI